MLDIIPITVLLLQYKYVIHGVINDDIIKYSLIYYAHPPQMQIFVGIRE